MEGTFVVSRTSMVFDTIELWESFYIELNSTEVLDFSTETSCKVRLIFKNMKQDSYIGSFNIIGNIIHMNSNSYIPICTRNYGTEIYSRGTAWRVAAWLGEARNSWSANSNSLSQIGVTATQEEEKQ